MRRLYAVQFGIEPERDVKVDFDRLRKLTEKWVQISYKRKFSFELQLPLLDAEINPINNHTVGIHTTSTVDESASLWSLEWSYPHEEIPNAYWHIVCEIAKFGNDIEFALILSVNFVSDTFTITHYPLERIAFGRPRIVHEIVDKFTCVLENRQLSSRAHEVSVVDVPSFVSDSLLANSRRLPIVLFSIDPQNNLPVASPELTAQFLVGLAEVFVLRDKWASFKLSEEIGKALSCYNGAVRLYYPGFSRHSAFRECPVYLRDNLVFYPNDRGFPTSLLRRFASTAGIHFSPGAINLRARHAIEASAISEQIQGMRSFGEYTRAVSDYSDLDEVYSSAEEQLEHYKKRLRELQLQNRTLQDNLETALSSIDAMQKYLQEENSVATEWDHEPEFASAFEAVNSAKERFDGTLIFLESVFVSARASPYDSPQRVYQALDAINEVSSELRSANSVEASLVDLFRARGFEYKSRVSPSLVKRHPDEYVVRYKGKEVSIESHLQLGKGRARTCLCIYFYWDQGDQYCIIAHVGKRKPR